MAATIRLGFTVESKHPRLAVFLLPVLALFISAFYWEYRRSTRSEKWGGNALSPGSLSSKYRDRSTHWPHRVRNLLVSFNFLGFNGLTPDST